jgi:hypothetical protein
LSLLPRLADVGRRIVTEYSDSDIEGMQVRNPQGLSLPANRQKVTDSTGLRAWKCYSTEVILLSTSRR